MFFSYGNTKTCIQGDTASLKSHPAYDTLVLVETVLRRDGLSCHTNTIRCRLAWSGCPRADVGRQILVWTSKAEVSGNPKQVIGLLYQVQKVAGHGP